MSTLSPQNQVLLLTSSAQHPIGGIGLAGGHGTTKRIVSNSQTPVRLLNVVPAKTGGGGSGTGGNGYAF